MFQIEWQIFFSNLLFSSYKLNIFRWECEKNEKPQIHFKTSLIQKYNISYIYNLLKGYKIDYELAWISMNLIKPTLNM